MAPRILSKKEGKSNKNLSLKFSIDCGQPVDDKVLVLNDFQEFLQKRIKVNGKAGNLQNFIQVVTEASKIVVTSTIPFSKRYLKYLTKKYLKKQTLRNYLYVTAKDKTTYVLKYFNIQQGNLDEE